MQHLTCIDVNNRSIKQKYRLHWNTDYNTIALFSVLILTASPPHSASTVEPDSVLS